MSTLDENEIEPNFGHRVHLPTLLIYSSRLFCRVASVISFLFPYRASINHLHRQPEVLPTTTHPTKMPAVTVANTFGAALIGLVASAIFYGLTVLQTYHYYKTYTQDRRSLKWFVGVMFAADTVHLILCTWCIYWYLVSRFGDFPNLDIPHWSINLQVVANAIVGVGVQMFFARRVWKLSRQVLLTSVIVVLSAMLGFFSVYFTVETFILDDFSKYARLRWVTIMSLGSAAAADILIALSLCYHLHKSRTGFSRTDTLITELMVYAINTGLITSIFATLTLILGTTMPITLIWAPFVWCLGRVYIISLLAMLNSREMLREVIRPPDDTMIHLSQLHFDGSKAYRYPMDQKKSSPSLNIAVETTTAQSADYIPSTVHV
ncbi:hypothetical protein BD410DRAFT_140771 [Rickenella mellea]|uniref:DUF6534 domain-containing protein n=1 Tax=Rickenella mellea TaxID=50990 RepID=A0A4Y7PI19_9AGAM|nr:hypothetical protein BD410DRAFT_140771 [Rickenella mellea]